MHETSGAILSLRPATASDSEFVYWVTEASMRRYVEQTFGVWLEAETRATFQPGSTLVVGYDGQDVGCIEIFNETDFVELNKLFIAPSHQGRGIGSLVLSRCLNWARENNRAVRLRVLRVNPAKRLYERHGFRIIEATKERYFMEWRPEARATAGP